jgi:hypothetical protein
MDPTNTQPQAPTQPTPPVPDPQTATDTTPITAAQGAPRPPQKTQINDTFARPLAPWPPAGTQPQEASSVKQPVNPAPTQTPDSLSQQTAQTIGQETAEAAGAVPNIDPSLTPDTLSPSTEVKPLTNVSDQNNPVLPPSPLDPSASSMSDEQAENLFKEEESTKKLFKKKKIKKVVKVIFALLLSLIILAGSYIFLMGNSAASSYKNQSSVAAYQEAFSEISDSLSANPVDAIKLNAGIDKLKTAEERNAKLSTVILGDLNPNYKKAKNLSGAITAYRESTKGYKEKYSYAEFLSALSASNSSVEVLQKLNAQTFTTVEDTLSLVKKTSEDCTKNTTALKDSAKPSDLSLASEAYQKALSDICTPLESTIQAILKDKTGALADTDKDALKSALNGVSNSSTSLINGSGPSSFYVNQLTSYLRSAQDEATKLKDSAASILKA